MQSHLYKIQPKEAGLLILWPMGTVFGLAALLHALVAIGWLPMSRPTRDVDQTIMVHQTDASRMQSNTELVFLGDSSCLMDVDARLLQRIMEKACLNLGTFSYLDLQAAAWLLEAFCKANPGHPDWVVVLFHPEALRRASPEPFAMQFLQQYLQGQPPPAQPGLHAQIQACLGLTLLRDRLLGRIVPTPLPGSFGRYYGFSTDLERYLSRNLGSALDPESRPFGGNAEYNLSPSLEMACRRFRESFPESVRLAIGITPIPESFAPPDYEDQYARMLTQWGAWINADLALTELPSTLPDADFAKTTHLNEAGRQVFTAHLGKALEEVTRN